MLRKGTTVDIKSNIREVINNTSSGGMVINEVKTHFLNLNLPFGGVNTSGMGRWHGHNGFLTFAVEYGVLLSVIFHSLIFLILLKATFDKDKNYDYIKSEMPPIGIVKYFTESMVKSNTMNLKNKTFVVYTDGVTEGYLKNGEELGAEGVQKIIDGMTEVTPKNIVESIEKKLNWGAEKLRDDITCMAININNTELIKKK